MNTTQIQNTVVRARIDSNIKNQAAATLADMGMTVSEAIRLLLVRIADERRLPFEVKAPRLTTKQAMTNSKPVNGKSIKL